MAHSAAEKEDDHLGKRRAEEPSLAGEPSSKLLRGSPRALATLATCALNQWALDFDGNLERVLESIRAAKAAGARYRLGPELELPGYGCEDHFYEQDTTLHSWQSLAAILRSGATSGIVCDIGSLCLFRGVRYNVRVFCLDGRVLLIRPKLHLADDGNYREGRWFTAWPASRGLEDFLLPDFVAEATSPDALGAGQRSCPFGFAALEFDDTSVGSETCEELFTPDAPHISLALDGVEILTNGSGSHHELRKLDTRLQLLRSATAKAGGAYLYANQQGCDGGRVYYDGCALVLVNGALVAQGSQFSLRDVEVLAAVVDLELVRSHRAACGSRSKQAAGRPSVPRVRVHFALCASPAAASRLSASPAVAAAHVHSPQEEIAFGPACWLWDFLQRSGAAGFFLPLSGGADSAATAAIVGCMCGLLLAAVTSGEPPGSPPCPGLVHPSRGQPDERVLRALRKATRSASDWLPADARELAGLLLHTSFMGTDNSSALTRDRAASLARQLGCHHEHTLIEPMVRATLLVFSSVCARAPRYREAGGSGAEDLALQNIQARLRMVLSYLLAQLLPWVRGREGFLLVLGSANVDEALRGYLTKYDCSSADLNPIGGVSKTDLRLFLGWAAEHLSAPELAAIVAAPPTAELRPLGAGGETVQTDEEDMGLSYADLSRLGSLRKLCRCGPVAMFEALRSEWGAALSGAQVAEKVKRFFRFYALNRHKQTVLTPSYHAEAYSPDDNRFDLRPFLYPVTFPRQFAMIDQMLAEAEAESAVGKP